MGIELTEEGRLIYGKLEALVAAKTELISAAEAISRSGKRELCIGTYSSVSNHILPDILMEFGKTHPDIRVSIKVGDKLGVWLKGGKADVLFTDMVESNDYICIPMLDDPYMAVVPEHLFPHRRTVKAEELYRFSYIETNESRISKYFDLNRFAGVLRLDSSDDTSVLAMVKEGLGVAVLPQLTVKRKYPGVKALTLTPKISRTLCAVYEKRTAAGRMNAAEEFGAFIADYMKKTK